MIFLNNELYHFGVKGMKWGVRKKQYKSSDSVKKKKHLGIKDNGNIGLITEKTSAKAKRNFAIKTSLFLSSMALTTYVATHPDSIDKAKQKVDKILKKIGSMTSGPLKSGYYSKSLKRMLTFDEAFDLGLDLSVEGVTID